ncbi:MAG: radical SAM protein, partial [Eggerthellaceae bacterium]|nr:radical SAM protein [Eggerthellaceae bacterium]
SQGRICRHFHLPLQAGSTKVLREMNRKYSAEEYRALVAKIYELMPGFSISTDIIVGFPGETEAEYQETLELAEACLFSKIHVFSYSIRDWTLAAARKDQVEPLEKSRRAAELLELSEKLRAQELAKRAGTTELCLVQENACALTESYFEIPAPKNSEVGKLFKISIMQKRSV